MSEGRGQKSLTTFSPISGKRSAPDPNSVSAAVVLPCQISARPAYLYFARPDVLKTSVYSLSSVSTPPNRRRPYPSSSKSSPIQSWTQSSPSPTARAPISPTSLSSFTPSLSVSASTPSSGPGPPSPSCNSPAPCLPRPAPPPALKTTTENWSMD